LKSIFARAQPCSLPFSLSFIYIPYLTPFPEMSFAKVARAAGVRTSALGNRGNDCYRLRAFRPHNSYNTQHGKRGRKARRTGMGRAHLHQRMHGQDYERRLRMHPRCTRWETATSEDNLKSARSVHYFPYLDPPSSRERARNHHNNGTATTSAMIMTQSRMPRQSWPLIVHIAPGTRSLA